MEFDGSYDDLQRAVMRKQLVGSSMPATYKGETTSEFNCAGYVNCVAENQVFAVPDPTATIGGASLIDGTNMLNGTEIIIEMNDAPNLTGTTQAPLVYLFRTNVDDATSTSGLTIVDIFPMILGDIARIPIKPNWGTAKFKIATNNSGGAKFNVGIKGVRYTPGS